MRPGEALRPPTATRFEPPSLRLEARTSDTSREGRSFRSNIKRRRRRKRASRAPALELLKNAPGHQQSQVSLADASAPMPPPSGRKTRASVQMLLLLIVCLALILVNGFTCLVGPHSALADRIRTRPGAASKRPSDHYVTVRTQRGQMFQGIRLASDANREPKGERADVIGFLGIRYASPPTKRLRFMPPTQFNYAPNQVHQVSQFGPICMQRFPMEFLGTAAGLNRSSQMATNWSHYGQNPDELLDMQMDLMDKLMAKSLSLQLRPLIKRLIRFDQSEDCLNLNVYAPREVLDEVGPTNSAWRRPADNSNETRSSESRLRPVLVIIHGESFDFGSGSSIDPLEFVRKQRLVVITFNYRLNILGFPPRLAGAATFGNLGFLDQVAALHWIRDHVGSFGGAADQVSLMGSRKGAIFANLLMLSPLAKGLFKRAIMEDGSALSPMVANQINWSAQSQLQPAPAANYIRLLATLCDCPVQLGSFSPTLGPVSRFQVAVQQHLTQVASNGSAGAPLAPSTPSNRQTGAPISGLNGQQLAPDESRANALMLECLRQKPIEQIMQRIPLDLLNFDAHQQHHHQVAEPEQPQQAHQRTHPGPAIQARWLRPIQLLQQVFPTDTEPQSDSSQTVSSLLNQQEAAISSGQLGQLINLVQSEQLNRLAAATASRQAKIPVPSPSVQLELDQLFSALYLAPNDTVRPLFGPQLDATMVQSEQTSAQQHNQPVQNHHQQGQLQQQQQHQTDLGGAMLSHDSPFGTRDLLIGLSYPVTSHHYQPATQVVPQHHQRHQRMQLDEKEQLRQLELESSQFELRPGHPMAERLAEQVQSSGLSDEQAVGVISSFVRPFYRFHQQEITNSIMNHYLTGNGWRMIRRRQQQQARQQKQNLQNQQQLFVLDSLLDSFQDALINVPLIRTALIHAARQLETLANIFVSRQVEKFNQSQSQSVQPDLLQQEEHQHPLEEQLIPNLTNEKFILDSIVSFAKGLYEKFQPPRADPSGHPSVAQQPHSTYLYQLDASMITKWVQQAIWGLERSGTKSGTKLSDSFHVMRLISQRLSKLLARLRKQEFRHQLSMGCVFQLHPLEYEAEFSEDDQLYWLFTGWICDKFGQLLANFVASGDVNHNQLQTEPARLRTSHDDQEYLQFESDCLLKQHHYEPQPDHQSIRLADDSLIDSNGSSNELDDSAKFYQSSTDTTWSPTLRRPASEEGPSDTSTELDCKLQLNHLTLKLLLKYELADGTSKETNEQPSQASSNWYESQVGAPGARPPSQETLAGSRWKVFNVFDQQIATLLKPPSGWQANTWVYWQMDNIVETIGQDASGDVTSESGGEPTTVMQTSDTNQLVEPKSTISARLAFWSNFISALNCTRTQPIIPTSMFSSPNATLLNLNLVQVNCNHHHYHPSAAGSTQPATLAGSAPRVTNVNSLLVSLGSNVRKQLQEQFNRFKLLRSRLHQHSANSSLQNHHSLRMANVSHQQVASLDETTNGSNQQTDNQLDTQTSKFNSTNLDFLTVSSSMNPDQHPSSIWALFAKIPATLFGRLSYNNNNNNNSTNPAGPASPRSSWLGVIVGVLLVSLTLVTASYAFFKHFNSRNKRDDNKAQMVLATDLRTLNITKDETIPCPHIKLQPVLEVEHENAYQVTGGGEMHSVVPVASDSQPQQTSSNSTTDSSAPLECQQTNLAKSSKHKLAQDANEYPLSSYWLPSHQQVQIGDVVEQHELATNQGCRLHSSSSTSSLLLLANGATSSHISGSKINARCQQPIMMPLIGYNNQQHQSGCSLAASSKQPSTLHQDHLRLPIQMMQFDDADGATATSANITNTTTESGTTNTSQEPNHCKHQHGELSQSYQYNKWPSIETNKQTNSLLSKKRVKISDPLGASRTMNRRHQQYHLSGSATTVFAAHEANQVDLQSDLNHSMLWNGQWSQESSFALDSSSGANNKLNYCPIHRLPSSSGGGELMLEHYDPSNQLVQHHVRVADDEDIAIVGAAGQLLGTNYNQDQYWPQRRSHQANQSGSHLSLGGLHADSQNHSLNPRANDLN